MKQKKKAAAAAKVKPPNNPRKDPRIQEIYEAEVTFNCPVRGKVTQKVKVKRYKPLVEQNSKHTIVSSNSIDKLENNDDGLSIYSDGESLELDVPGETEQ